jgi:hypothetical protein
MGQVMIHAEAMSNDLRWNKYEPSSRVESAAKISQCLKTLSDRQVQLRNKDASKRVAMINGDRIVRWSEEHGIGSPERLREALAQKNERMPMNVVDLRDQVK